ncbi:hypothetical protein FIBSPDRAFT_875113, partial [Athelia psychrophila]
GGSSGGYTRIQKAMSAEMGQHTRRWKEHICESRSVSHGHCQGSWANNNESLESDAMASA